MAFLNIARQRLYNQHIASTRLEKPGNVVGWLGAVQAQESRQRAIAEAARHYGAFLGLPAELAKVDTHNE